MLSKTDKKNKAKRKRLHKRYRLINIIAKQLRKHNPKKYKYRADPRLVRAEFLKCNNRETNDSNNSIEA